MKRGAEPISPAELVRQVAALRDRLSREAAEAASLCEKVLSGPQLWWPQRLRAGRRGPTTGVVQQLLERMRTTLEQSPATAQAMTALAVELAHEIEDETYPRVHVQLTRAQALRDHAFVLSFRGLFAEALETAERAGRAFAGRPFPAWEGARLALVKASIYRNTGRTDEAVQLAREAAETFLRFGDRCKHVEARICHGAMLYAAGAIRPALEVWRPLENEAGLDDPGRVRLAHNVALCLSDLGEHEDAVSYLSRCTMEFELLGMATESTRSRAALGKALLGAGRPRESLTVLRRAAGEFESQGLIFDAGLVALQEAEALLTLNRRAEVPAVCRTALAHFTAAGVAAYAATALAYLREATTLPPATPQLVRDAHTSLRRLAAERPRLFAGGWEG